jgi:membrane associated rhomboid family serine protease
MYFFYYVPVGIDAGRRRFPVVTALCAVACTVFFALVKYFPHATGIDFYGWIYFPGHSAPLSVVSAAFLHFGWVHLIGNLTYLILFGMYLEDRMGSLLFLLLFIGSAVFGNWAQGYYNLLVLDVNTGIIGASGAVSGILGAFLIRLYRSRVRIAWWVFAPLLAYTRAGRSDVPAVFAVALWVLLQVVRSLLQFEGASANVAHMTHIAGFAFGIVFALATGGWRRGREEAHLLKARRFMAKGDFYSAQDEYSAYLHYKPWDGEIHGKLARVLVQAGDDIGARAEYLKSVECLMREGRRGRAESVYQEALRGFGTFVLSADPQLDLAFGLERNLKTETALKAYQNFLARYSRHEEAPFALLRVANIHRGELSEPEQALACYTRLIEQYPEDAWVDFAREQVRQMA